MQFEFATATRIIFGPGTASQLSAIARAFGSRAFVVTGADASRCAGSVSGLDHLVFPVDGEPTVDRVKQGVVELRERACDVVIGLGGGSAIDAGKAIAALAANPGDVLDYLEVIGRAQPLHAAPLPFIAVPTTAGTGAEVTRNAVLGSPEHGVKASLRSPLMLPKVALVDPDLTIGLPGDVTASTGLDALTQLIEPYVSARRNWMTDLFCREGIERAASALPRVFSNGNDAAARETMSFAALLGGLALANAGLGAVHGFAAPIGGMFPAPHGAVCAALLPHVMEANIAALREREPKSNALDRYQAAAVLLTNDGLARPEDGARRVADLCQRFQIPPLSTYGLRHEYLPELVEKASRASSMKGNPIALTKGELQGILEAAL